MTQIVYVKGILMIDRIHHRFLSKKRNWLVRQIDPSKAYMKLITKPEEMDEMEESESEQES